MPLMVRSGIASKVSILCICSASNCASLSNSSHKLLSGCTSRIKWLLICMRESASKSPIICSKRCASVSIRSNSLLLPSLRIASALAMRSRVKGERNSWEMSESSLCCPETI
ncbi:Uncharacterised protein [Vibrio cholerae]|nr:Uncharacterised protein [Vibrio cholerae]